MVFELSINFFFSPPVTSLDLVNFLFALVWSKDDKSLIVGSINDKMMNLKEKHMTRPNPFAGK